MENQTQNKKKSLLAVIGVNIGYIVLVFLIITFIVALLIPVFFKTEGAPSRQQSCLSNIKSTCARLNMYADDNDGYFPPASIKSKISPDNQFWTPGYIYWQQLSCKYSGNINFYFCPSSPKMKSTPIIANYGINELMLPFYDGLGNKKTIPVNIEDVVNRAETYLILDAGNFVINPDMCKGICKGNKYLPGVGQDPKVSADSALKNDKELYKDFLNGRHFEGVNVGFCDGHAKYLKSSDVSAEANKPGFGAWSPK